MNYFGVFLVKFVELWMLSESEIKMDLVWEVYDKIFKNRFMCVHVRVSVRAAGAVKKYLNLKK